MDCGTLGERIIRWLLQPDGWITWISACIAFGWTLLCMLGPMIVPRGIVIATILWAIVYSLRLARFIARWPIVMLCGQDASWLKAGARQGWYITAMFAASALLFAAHQPNRFSFCINDALLERSANHLWNEVPASSAVIRGARIGIIDVGYGCAGGRGVDYYVIAMTTSGEQTVHWMWRPEQNPSEPLPSGMKHLGGKWYQTEW